MMNREVLIVGGGIGGLSSAFALTRAGFDVRLFEQAPEFGEVGAGIQLAPNCTRILAELGLLERVLSVGVAPTRMVMRDALDGGDLTALDLVDVERRYGFPYVVIHRTDLHAVLLDACREAGVELVNDAEVVRYQPSTTGVEVTRADGATDGASVVIAADGLHSVARRLLSDDEPRSSAYVAYRGTVPIEEAGLGADVTEVVVYVGPGCHFVQYGLRGGQLLNQVAVFQSRKALAGLDEWGTPDELEGAFAGTCDRVRQGLGGMWRDRWWRMFDRDPISTWVTGRLALLGDAAHAPLQYLAQGAIMAIEDGWVLAHHAAQARVRGEVDWDTALTSYQAVRTKHCRRVVTTARAWGELWHLDGEARVARNHMLRARDLHDYGFIDWLYGPTALTPEQEPPMFRPVPLAPVS